MKVDKTLKYAAHAGALMLALNTLTAALILLALPQLTLMKPSWLSPILGLTTQAVTIIFYWGYKTLAQKTQNKLLTIAAYVGILIAAKDAATIIFTTTTGLEWLTRSALIMVVLYAALTVFADAVLAIIFGAALLKLQKQYDQTAKAAGTLEILAGAFMATILLGPTGFILKYLANATEILLLHKAAKEN